MSNLTDLEKMESLFTELGITYDKETLPSRTTPYMHSPKRIELTCYAGTKAIKGYGGFVAEFTFDKDGKFIEMGIWE